MSAGRALRACLRGVFDWFPPNAGVAKFGNLRVPIDQDNVVIRAAKGAKEVVASFKFLGSGDVVFSEDASKFAWKRIKAADQQITTDLAISKDAFQARIEALKTDPDLDAEVKAFWRNQIAEKDLSPAARPYAEIKADFLNYMNATPALQKQGKNKSKTIWRMDSDIMSPLLKNLNDPNRPFTGAFDMQTVLPKQLVLKGLNGTADDFTAHDFFLNAFPQLIRKHYFDDAIRVASGALKEMKSAPERRYMQGLINRMAGKKTDMERVLDGWVDNVRQKVGASEALKFSPSAKVAGGITRALYRGIMWYNPGMALLNTTQTVNTMAKFGALRTFDSALTLATNKQARMLAAEARALGSLDEFWRSAPTLLEQADNFGFWMFEKAEHINRGIAFNLGLSDFMIDNGIKDLSEFIKLNKTDNALFNKGIRAGIDASNETQFLYSQIQTAPLLSSRLGKLGLGQFTSFPIKQTEFLYKNIRQQGGGMFALRYMAYTGIASWLLHDALGIAVGRELGGGGSIPIARDLLKEGRGKEALWVASSGVLKFLPDRFQVERGFTPALGLMLDTLALGLSNEDPNITWARWGRSMMSTLPAGLAIRRGAEAVLAAMENGQIVEPGSSGIGGPESALEATAVLPLLDRMMNEVGVGGIPGVRPRFSGRLSTVENTPDLIKRGLGLRSANASIRSEILTARREGIAETRQQRSILTDRAAIALKNGNQDEFAQALLEAMQTGEFTDPKDFFNSLTASVIRRSVTKETRQLKEAPRAFRRKEAFER